MGAMGPSQPAMGAMGPSQPAMGAMGPSRSIKKSPVRRREHPPDGPSV